MAKFEYKLKGNILDLVNAIHEGILRGSISASFEDESRYETENMICIVQVYERYSMLGENRVSLSVTVAGDRNNNIFVSGITSGGSKAVLFKINTFGEEAFLEHLERIVREFD